MPSVPNPKSYIDLNYQGPTKTNNYLIAQQTYNNLVAKYNSGDTTVGLSQIQIAQKNLTSYIIPKGEVYSTEAIKQTIKMLLSSFPGDYIREIDSSGNFKGGILYKYIGKTLTDANTNAIITDISSVLSSIPNIVVDPSGIIVKADLIGKRWTIKIVFSDTYNKFTDSTNLAIQAGP